MSAHERYRATGALETALIMVVVAAGIALNLAVLSQLPKDVHGGVAFGVMLGMALPTIAAIAWVIVGTGRRRARRMGAVLGRAGFAVHLDPTVEQQTDAVNTIGRLAMLAPSPAYVTWVARKPTPAGEAVVLRHEQVIGSGKGARAVVHLVVAVPMPRAVTSGVWLTRQGFLERRASDAQGVPDLQVGDASLDKPFRIQAHDPAEPARLLNRPPVRDLILSGPSRESWALTATHALCIFRADTTPTGLGVMLRRARAMTDLLARG